MYFAIFILFFFISFPFVAESPTWGDWGEWGDCSVTCEGGTRSRVKTCNDDDTSDSETCEGDAPTDTEDCNDEDCRKLQNYYYNFIVGIFFINLVYCLCDKINS